MPQVDWGETLSYLECKDRVCRQDRKMHGQPIGQPGGLCSGIGMCEEWQKDVRVGGLEC